MTSWTWGGTVVLQANEGDTMHKITVTETEQGDTQAVCSCRWEGTTFSYTGTVSPFTQAHESGDAHIDNEAWLRRNA